MIRDMKNPAPWLSWGGDLRLRNEYFNNAMTLTSDPNVNPKNASLHEQDYFRFRGRLWASITPAEDFTFNTRVTAEPKWYTKPASVGTHYNQTGMEWRYGIVDALNVQWREPLKLPATLTVGRQDIGLGDGWLVKDGTSYEGSWTYFLDAARLTYELAEQKTTIDAIGILQYGRPDAWLPTIGSSTSAGSPPYLLTDQDERGAILWIANKSLPAANLDGYFIYKHDTRLNNDPAAACGDNADIFTVGGRLSGALKTHWYYSFEGAYQFGQKQDPLLNKVVNGTADNPYLDPSAQTDGYRTLDAFGLNSKFGYQFKDKLNNEVFLFYEFLSGDDPKTGNDEMFDVLWGRYVRLSEIYNAFAYTSETRINQIANLHRFGPGWGFNPITNMNFTLSYNLLYADQAVPTRQSVAPAAGSTTTPFTGTDNFRGHYLQAILRYKFSEHLSGHLWSEFVFPGHFYTSCGETMTFLRAELVFTF